MDPSKIQSAEGQSHLSGHTVADHKEVKSQIPEDERLKLATDDKAHHIHRVTRHVSSDPETAKQQLVDAIKKSEVERSARPVESKDIPSTFQPPEPQHQHYEGHPNARHMLYDQRGTDMRNFQPGNRGTEH